MNLFVNCVAAAACVVLTSCGEGPADVNESIAVSDFKNDVEDICIDAADDLVAQAADLGRVPADDPDGVRAQWASELRAQIDEVAQDLDMVTAPPSVSADFQRLVDGVEDLARSATGTAGSERAGLGFAIDEIAVKLQVGRCAFGRDVAGAAGLTTGP